MTPTNEPDVQIDSTAEAKALLGTVMPLVDELQALTPGETKLEFALSQVYGFSPEAYVKVMHHLAVVHSGIATAILLGIALERGKGGKDGN